jgi:hypothetical protein
MAETLVWAYKPLPELQNQTGFVACADVLAQQLIKSGAVQDTAVGALYFKEIQKAEAAPLDPGVVNPAEPLIGQATVDASSYDTKVMRSKRSPATKTAG